MALPNQSAAQNGHAQADKYTGLNTSDFHGHDRRKFRQQDPRNLRVTNTRAPCFEITANDWVRICQDALRAYMESESITEKELAQRIGCTDRTVENYTQGRCAPSGLNLLRCLATIPHLAAQADRLTGLEADLDPEAERARNDLIRAAWKFAEITNGASE